VLIAFFSIERFAVRAVCIVSKMCSRWLLPHLQCFIFSVCRKRYAGRRGLLAFVFYCTCRMVVPFILWLYTLTVLLPYVELLLSTCAGCCLLPYVTCCWCMWCSVSRPSQLA